ncbi:MAG: Mur ligase family protein [Butyrivibrio sp.]|nr:Mur ligase family protein [Butyrivibrio sp.]
MTKETKYIYDIPKFNKKSSADNTKEMLRRLDCADIDSKIIHIAGTNGKGSTCAYLGSILREAGYSVGIFTSPHLVRLNERIVIDGASVGDEEFEKTFEIVRNVSEDMVSDGLSHPSFFEFLFGMAMYIFKRRNPDYIILETGLGGRLDATNVFSRPELTIITSISLDHTDILGDSIDKIAYEKAGILKQGVPCVVFANDETAASVIEGIAKQRKSPVCRIERNDIRICDISDKRIDFCLKNSYYDSVCFSIANRAVYQIYNASTALVAAACLGVRDMDVLQAGLMKMHWIGRMQTIRRNFIIDGAHNDDGIDNFLESVARDGRESRALIFSCVSDKNYESVIQKICNAKLFDCFILTRLADRRGLDTGMMKACFTGECREHIEIIEKVSDACDRALVYIEQGKTVYAAGSLYLVGEILSQTGLVQKEE